LGNTFFVILSEAKDLVFRLRINSAKEGKLLEGEILHSLRSFRMTRWGSPLRIATWGVRRLLPILF